MNGFRVARLNAQKTVKEVMAYMGVSDASVYLWETGCCKPTAAKLPKLAMFYGCSIDDLLADEPDGQNRAEGSI